MSHHSSSDQSAASVGELENIIVSLQDNLYESRKFRVALERLTTCRDVFSNSFMVEMDFARELLKESTQETGEQRAANSFQSQFGIGEKIFVNASGGMASDGVVVGVHFTKSKVTYDIDFNIGGETLYHVDSTFVQKMRSREEFLDDVAKAVVESGALK